MRKLATSVTPKQCMRARALLKWNTHDLANRTNIPVRHLEKFEHNKVKLLKPEHKEIIETFAKKNIVIYANGDVEVDRGDNNEGLEIKYGRTEIDEEMNASGLALPIGTTLKPEDPAIATDPLLLA